MDPMKLWSDMGPVGKTVVVILLLLSAYSLTVMISKFSMIRSAVSESRQFSPLFAALTKSMATDQVVLKGIEMSARYKHSFLAKVVHTGLLEFQNESGKGLSREELVAAVERAVENECAVRAIEMEHGLGWLATIGSTAPFIGLFGTVVGILTAFTGIATTGSGGLAAVSSGIAEALATTAIGLLVAIPAVFAFNIFTTRLRRLQTDMNSTARGLVDFFLKRTAPRSDPEPPPVS